MDRDNPNDIFQQDGAAHSFDVVIRGYDRSQVHDVVDRLDGELRVALADKDASAARAAELASHLSAAQAELESLRQQAQSAAAPNFESMGARISHMLKLAEEEANDIRRIAAEDHARSQAELKATTVEGDRIRTEAETQVQRMTEEAQAEARRVTEEAQDAAAKTVSEAQRQSDELNERARASAEQAEVDSKGRVAKIEEDFQLAQKARRAEAARVEQERDQSSRRDAQNRIEQATRRSDEIVGAAEQRVTELDSQRGELHARLLQIRELLGGLPDIAAAMATEPGDGVAAAKPSPPKGNNSQPEAPRSEVPEGGAKNAKNAKDAKDGGAKDEPGNATAERPERPERAERPEPAEKPDPVKAQSDDEPPTDVQGPPPPPPPTAPSWPVNAPTQAIQIPRQG